MVPQRNISLKCSSDELEKGFGLDIAIFFQYYKHLIILLISQFIVFLPFTAIFTTFDQLQFNFDQENNFYLIIIQLAIDVIPAFYWSIILCANIFYFFNIKRQRMVQDVVARTQYQIQDYAVIAYNISKDVASNVVFSFLEEHLGENCIEDYLRIEDPSVLKRKLNYISMQKQFYKLLTCNPTALIKQNNSFYRFCLKFKVQQFVQLLGLNRDILYYDNKLISLKQKIEKQISLKKKEKEGIIIIFSNVKTRENALKLNQKIKINKLKLHIKKAFNPDDILYANISTVDEHRWRQQFLTFCILILVSTLSFIGIKYVRDKQYEYISNKDTQFERIFINGITIFGIMFIPLIFRPIFSMLVQLERHSSYSSYNRSKTMKFFIFTIFNKLSIIYFRGFSQMLENQNHDQLKQFKEYSNIFSPLSKTWRTGPNTTGLDFVLIIFSYLLGYNFTLAAIFCIQIIIDKKNNNEGIAVHISQVYVANLVVFTLTECYAFQQPWMILIAIGYYVSNYYLLKFVLLKYGKPPPRTVKISTIIEIIIQYINIGAYLALIQFTFNAHTIWWFLGFIVFIVLLNLTVNSQIFNNFINKSANFKAEYINKQYRIQHNPSYQNICFNQYYALPQQLDNEDYLNMQYLIKSIKNGINLNLQTGQQPLAWSKSLDAADYSLSLREPTIFIASESIVSDHISCDISGSEMVLFLQDKNVINK